MNRRKRTRYKQRRSVKERKLKKRKGRKREFCVAELALFFRRYARTIDSFPFSPGLLSHPPFLFLRRAPLQRNTWHEAPFRLTTLERCWIRAIFFYDGARGRLTGNWQALRAVESDRTYTCIRACKNSKEKGGVLTSTSRLQMKLLTSSTRVACEMSLRWNRGRYDA